MFTWWFPDEFFYIELTEFASFETWKLKSTFEIDVFFLIFVFLVLDIKHLLHNSWSVFDNKLCLKGDECDTMFRPFFL